MRRTLALLALSVVVLVGAWLIWPSAETAAPVDPDAAAPPAARLVTREPVAPVRHLATPAESEPTALAGTARLVVQCVGRPNMKPLPGVGIAIAGDGEILISGATVNTLGSLRTGDLGRIGSGGRLTVIGRKGDVIITGGENVVPTEVEAVLAEHPGVAESAVFARSHPLWGEAVTALVVAKPGAELTQAALRKHCLERLAAFKVPKAFELTGELPKTSSGKVRRADLR